jgi:hypothetical protein
MKTEGTIRSYDMIWGHFEFSVYTTSSKHLSNSSCEGH